MADARHDRGPAANDGAGQVGGPATRVLPTPDTGASDAPGRLSDVYTDPADAELYLRRWATSATFRRWLVVASGQAAAAEAAVAT